MARTTVASAAASTDSNNSSDGIGAYSIIWQRSSTKIDWQAFPFENSKVLSLTQSHVCYSYRWVVSGTDRQETREILMTSPSETDANVDDPVEGVVLFTGETLEGKMLAANTTRVFDGDGVARLTNGSESSKDSLNWQSVETAKTSRFDLSWDMVVHQVHVGISVIDTFGIETVILSQATNRVEDLSSKTAGKILVRRVGNYFIPQFLAT